MKEQISSFLVGIPEAVLKTEKVEQKHKHLKEYQNTFTNAKTDGSK